MVAEPIHRPGHSLRAYAMNALSSDPFIATYDDVLSIGNCNKIIKIFNASLNKTSSLAGGQYLPEQKKGLSLSLNFKSNEYESTTIGNLILPCLIDRLNLYKDNFPFLTSKLAFWRLENFYHIQYFGQNDGCFAIHCEQGGPPVARRILTWLMYLNDASSGTKFYHQDVIITARHGRLVLWPASWTHMHSGVIPNIDNKYIVSGWFSFY